MSVYICILDATLHYTVCKHVHLVCMHRSQSSDELDYQVLQLHRDSIKQDDQMLQQYSQSSDEQVLQLSSHSNELGDQMLQLHRHSIEQDDQVLQQHSQSGDEPDDQVLQQHSHSNEQDDQVMHGNDEQDVEMLKEGKQHSGQCADTHMYFLKMLKKRKQARATDLDAKDQKRMMLSDETLIGIRMTGLCKKNYSAIH